MLLQVTLQKGMGKKIKAVWSSGSIPTPEEGTLGGSETAPRCLQGPPALSFPVASILIGAPDNDPSYQNADKSESAV